MQFFFNFFVIFSIRSASRVGNSAPQGPGVYLFDEPEVHVLVGHLQDVPPLLRLVNLQNDEVIADFSSWFRRFFGQNNNNTFSFLKERVMKSISQLRALILNQDGLESKSSLQIFWKFVSWIIW